MKEVPFESSAFPVLGIDDQTNKLKGIGTCTLTRLDNERFFLINSAHTLDHWGDNPIFIALPNGKTIELPFALKTKTEAIDKVDIAVTPLLGEFATVFFDKSISSLPLYDDFPYENYSSFAKRVVFFGFPASNSRFTIDLKKNTIKAKPVCITSVEVKNISNKIAKFYNIDPSLHILAKFEKRKMKDQNRVRKIAPDPYGISGGPVFFAYVEEGEHEDILKAINFVGIGNEYLQNRSLLKATRKEVILSFIRDNLRLIYKFV